MKGLIKGFFYFMEDVRTDNFTDFAAWLVCIVTTVIIGIGVVFLAVAALYKMSAYLWFLPWLIIGSIICLSWRRMILSYIRTLK